MTGSAPFAEEEGRAEEPGNFIVCNRFIKRKEVKMGDKGKKDKGKREDQKKSKSTLKEKRQHKKDKVKSSSAVTKVFVKSKGNSKGKG